MSDDRDIAEELDDIAETIECGESWLIPEPIRAAAAEIRRLRARVAELEGEPAIHVWRFHDAPRELQELSTNGGDEDWLAVVPAKYADEWIGWLDSGSSFGCCCVDEFNRADDSKVFIGSHS